MNITSFNIKDVSYHYIGLRVLDKMPTDSNRSRQIEAISRNVLKFVNDKALRLMLPEPRGTFQAVGEKICQELTHFQFVQSERTPYELTEDGKHALDLLSSRQYRRLRQLMACVHLETYDNLRAVVQKHIEAGSVQRPIVDLARLTEEAYLQRLLEPTFGQDAAAETEVMYDSYHGSNSKKIEDALHSRIIRRVMPCQNMKVALFRTICDRLVSLRLLNSRRLVLDGFQFIKTYSPCVLNSPSRPWYSPLDVPLTNDTTYRIYLCEPDMGNACHQAVFLKELDKAFNESSSEAGYYDIPDLRDLVCERLMIPEAAFDEGLNNLLDRKPPILSTGLRYERITPQRRPLVRKRGDTRLHNLIRRL